MSKKKIAVDLPKFDALIIPVIEALVDLGGSGSIEEINQKVYENTKLSEAQIEIPHGDDGKTEVEYRLSWARTYLKKSGYVENSARGIWALTNAEVNIKDINTQQIVKSYRDAFKPSKKGSNSVEESVIEELALEQNWKELLLSRIYKISSSAFERLSQRLLRESGFIQVEVTGKSGDGGIDGKGIIRMNGFLTFHIIFQCKRWKGSIPAREIRDFRGAMQGRTDKGLFITTGTFTRDAIKESIRDGAPPIDLIDGDLLCEKLKELKLGVVTEFVESVLVQDEWFEKL